jgi:16S rRNA (adenine1518-N6/adenine1519-N6)-dimethyltransferase
VTTLRDSVPSFLRAHGVRLNTNLGQHFLVDEDVLETIVETGNIHPDAHVVEIGPGIGVLTRELLAHAGAVTAIELDERMVPLLTSFITGKHDADPSKLTVIHDNALHVPFPTSPYSVIANIPYHITSPLLRHAYLESTTAPTSMTLLIQREVAEKICDDEHASLLTIIVRLFGTPTYICTVPPGSFLPPPAVDSAVIHIVSHVTPICDRSTIDQVIRLAKIAFGGKRKMLRNTLGHFPDGAAALQKAGIDMTRRPETLRVQEWIEVSRSWPLRSDE